VKLTALTAAILTIGLLPHQDRAIGQTQQAQEDRSVLATVLEATVLPVHRNTKSGATEPLAVVNETTPLCMERRENRCRIPEHWVQFLSPDAARKWVGLFPDERTRRQVVASLEIRNTESHPLPLSQFPGVVFVDLRKNPPANTLDQHYRRKLGAASLSLPGYSTNGHALVYGSYSCGGLCGYGWLFVLEKVGGQWRQKSATVTVIS
jgi:hypothetical protein